MLGRFYDLAISRKLLRNTFHRSVGTKLVVQMLKKHTIIGRFDGSLKPVVTSFSVDKDHGDR